MIRKRRRKAFQGEWALFVLAHVAFFYLTWYWLKLLPPLW
jgi:hypothetical protein